MQDDLALIEKLEQQFGVTFKKARGVQYEQYSYVLNETGHVVRLSCPDVPIQRMPAPILGLRHLRSLYLTRAKITHLPKELANLKDLKYLEIFERCMIRSIHPRVMDLGLPIHLYRVGSYRGICLVDAPLEEPPVEIVTQGREAILVYFDSLKGKRTALNEIKVLLIGDGGAGKTSLVRRFVGERFNSMEPQTHGINIRSWELPGTRPSVRVRFWDFGGQEIMHATHQFFLSKRSIYILVLDGRRDEKTEYWLKHIQSFGGDSPVVVALNKTDQNPAFDVNRRFLLRKYPSIRGFYRVSCAKGSGIADLLDGVREAVRSVDIVKTTWAANWFGVKEHLERIESHYISYDEYETICTTHGINDEKSTQTLLDFLHDLGVVLHFRDFKLLDTHVLEPEWVTQAVYRILNSPR
ncbi:MAG: COR domain-containing protein, partial [Planctomycetota bacterium]